LLEDEPSGGSRVDAFGGWLLGIAGGMLLGYVLGLVKQQAEHEHYHRHHDPSSYPHLIWSRHFDRLTIEGAKRNPRRHNVAT
jgi:hypothetical protein